ncbi:MAG TPA: cell division protein ZapA [Bdellovibrionota bacterium]|jgi:cell division protein ZapA (FtsZ GTPase activity inhibitor)|nr:cell division protein ZapA [Bdellovibrionota bacterium]
MHTAQSALEISIQGQRIPLRARHDDPEKVQEVVELVSERLRDAEKRSKSSTAPHQVALLALLDLAEEFLRVKEKTEAFKKQMSEKSERLISLLEAELK